MELLAPKRVFGSSVLRGDTDLEVWVDVSYIILAIGDLFKELLELFFILLGTKLFEPTELLKNISEAMDLSRVAFGVYKDVLDDDDEGDDGLIVMECKCCSELAGCMSFGRIIPLVPLVGDGDDSRTTLLLLICLSGPI